MYYDIQISFFEAECEGLVQFCVPMRQIDPWRVVQISTCKTATYDIVFFLATLGLLFYKGSRLVKRVDICRYDTL